MWRRARGGSTVDAVVVVEVGEGLGVGEVVDGDDLEIRDLPLMQRAHDAATNAAKPVDGDLRRHALAPCTVRPSPRGDGSAFLAAADGLSKGRGRHLTQYEGLVQEVLPAIDPLRSEVEQPLIPAFDAQVFVAGFGGGAPKMLATCRFSFSALSLSAYDWITTR